MTTPKGAFGARPPEWERIALWRPGGDASRAQHGLF
jgi:hypothetical protein